MKKRLFVLLYFVLFGLFLETAANAAQPDCDKTKLVADSIRYLQKSIPKSDPDRNTTSLSARIAPISTVLSGLLDAGLNEDEPIIRAGLDYLHSLTDSDGNIRSADGTFLKKETVLVQKCLQKSKEHHRKQSLAPINESEAISSCAERLIAQWGDSKAICRSVQFLRKRSQPQEHLLRRLVEHGNTTKVASNVLAGLPTEPFVFSQGIGQSIRIQYKKHEADPSSLLATAKKWTTAEYGQLFASVSGAGFGFPIPQPYDPQHSNRLVDLAVLPNAGCQKTQDSLSFVGTTSPIGVFSFDSFSVEKTIDPNLLSGYVLVIRTNCRLE